MKKIGKNIIAKLSLLCLMVISQTQLWAQSAGDTGGSLNQAMNKPAFWIGIALFIACIVGFILVGRDKKEQQYE